MNFYNSILDTIGETPLVRLRYFEEAYGIEACLLAKVDSFNPAGSAKDRVAFEIVYDAEQRGELKEGGTIVEPTSGNTGIGLAMVGAVKGYKVILTMPDTMSVERIKLMRAYGAQVVLTDGALGMKGAIEKAEQLVREIPGAIMAGQFTNFANIVAHYATTGREIYRDTDERVNAFVAGIGTGGTITGVGRYLKEKNSKIKVIGFEPKSSPFLTKGKTGAHKLQGIGAGFKPEVLDLSMVDRIVTVPDDKAMEFGRLLAQKEGILAGITSGASVYTAVQVARRMKKGQILVCMLPDTGERYLSSEVFE